VTHEDKTGEPAVDRGRARELLVDELKDAVGEDAVERADLDVDGALDRQPRSLRAAFVSSRLLLVVVGAALLTTGVIASMATESWVFFGLALLAHALFACVVIAAALTITTQVEKPGPTTVTALEAEGVADPEGALNDLVEQVSESEEGSRVERMAKQDETVAPQDDRAASTAAQQSASTPASEPTKPVPGQ
jgi:hypothetical protein